MDAEVRLFNTEAVAHVNRSQTTESTTDTGTALMYLGAARAIAKPGSDAMRMTLLHIGIDLDAAIDSAQAALEAMPSGDVSRPGVEAMFGKLLLERSARRRDADDRREVLVHLHRAADDEGPESPLYTVLLGDLGHCCHVDYLGVSRSQDMLNAAVEFYIRAIASTPVHDTNRPQAFLSLANALRDRYHLSSDPLVLDEGLRCYRDEAVRGLAIRPAEGVRAAFLWGSWLTEREDWPAAAEAFSLGLAARLQLVTLQASRRAKESWLREGQHMPAEAEHMRAKLPDARDAVLAVETGRAILLTEVLALARSDLSALPAELSHLDERFRRAAQRWSEVQSAIDTSADALLRRNLSPTS